MSVTRLPLRKKGIPKGRSGTTRKLFLAFRLGADRYVMAATDIVAVRRYETARPAPGAPSWVCGLITHDQRPVPLIDLTARAMGVPSRRVTSTRIVLVNYTWPHSDTPSINMLGVLVEQATETIHLNPEAFVASGLHIPSARYLGPVIDTGEGFIQWIRVQDLLDDEVCSFLMNAVAQSSDSEVSSTAAGSPSP